MKTLLTSLIILLLAAGGSAQVPLSGDFGDHIDSILASIPGATPEGLYLQPGAASRDIWRSIIQEIMANDYAAADSIGASINYRVVEFTDTSVSPSKVYYILERTPGSTSRYWGTFVFNPEPFRPTLVIECPHPLHDLNTGDQGFYAFRKASALAYFVAGTHRCNGTTFSTCDGTTSACSATEQSYRYSDQAHVIYGTFQLTTEEMLAVVPDLIVIQPHGFSQESGDPDIIMSNGTRLTPTEDWLLALRDNLLQQDGSLTFKVAHVDTDWDRLIARTNCQGRLINNGSDPCGTYATETTGRFLHLEQKYSGLRDSEANWNKLANAIIATFPPMYAFATVQSGSWTDPSTWQGGAVPTVDDDVTISAGHTVSVDDTLAVCRSLNFGGNDALIDMNADSRLTIYGDISLFSETHNVFSAGWSASNAVVQFAGGTQQTLSGWSTTAGSTSFRDVVIAKDSGTVVTTAGTDMRLGIQNSLAIVSGGFVLADGDDLEARWASSANLTGNQDLAIMVHAGATFELVDGDGTHWVRSQTGSAPIGPMTIYGEAIFTDASSSDISLANITVKDGGQLTLSLGLGSTTYGPEFNPGTVTVEPGGTLFNETTSGLWFDTSVVILQRGGIYKTSSSTTPWPPTFINDGRVRYQRNPSTATTDQQVVDTNYFDVEFSFNGNGTKKIWDLTASRTIADSLEVNNSAEVVVTASSPQILTVDSTLRLTSGSIDNSDADATILLSNGASISRATGTIAAAPTFAGVVDVRYTSTTSSVTTGPELPTGANALRDLTIYSTDQTVTLGADVTVNGVLRLTRGGLWTDSYAITLAASATIDEESTLVVLGSIIATRDLTQSTEEDFGGLGIAVTAAGAAPGSTTVVRLTGESSALDGGNSILRRYQFSPAVNTGLDATVVFEYADAELNGLSEEGLGLYCSFDDGASWELLGGLVDSAANTLTLGELDSLGWLTLGASVTYCCIGSTGNFNGDAGGTVDLSDLIYAVNYSFLGGPAPTCFAAANVNGDVGCTVDLSDLIYLVNYLFLGGPNPMPCDPNCE